jgi:hypothetical protein
MDNLTLLNVNGRTPPALRTFHWTGAVVLMLWGMWVVKNIYITSTAITLGAWYRGAGSSSWKDVGEAFLDTISLHLGMSQSHAYLYNIRHSFENPPMLLFIAIHGRLRCSGKPHLSRGGNLGDHSECLEHGPRRCLQMWVCDERNVQLLSLLFGVCRFYFGAF